MNEGKNMGLKAIPLSTKLVITSIGGSAIFLIVFVTIILAPLMALGIIDIDLGGTSGNPFLGYSSVTENTTFWWPIGSIETEVVNNVTYAWGEPVETIITSEFGLREDPFNSSEANHGGVDLAPYGYGLGEVPVIASKGGTVIYPSEGDPTSCPSSDSEDGCGQGFGNFVMIDHGDGYVTLYGHLFENSISVRAGDEVRQGQVIAKAGSSGRSTGLHLHFEVRVNGERVNPLNYISSSEPRNPQNTLGEVVGSDNKQTVCMTLKSYDIPTNGIAGIMTNIAHESSEFDPTVLGDSGTSYGLCQWHAERYASLVSSFPSSYNTIGSQISYLMYELKNSYTSVYSIVTDGSSKTSDITYKFCIDFERPDGMESTCRARADSLSSEYEAYVKNGCK